MTDAPDLFPCPCCEETPCTCPTLFGEQLDGPASVRQSPPAPPAGPAACACCGEPLTTRRGAHVGRITLGIVPRGMNEREGLLMRKAVYVVRQEKEQIFAAIERVAPALRPAAGRRMVQIRFVKGPRTRKRDDPGNRGARSKAILDGLVRAGLLIDDTDEFLVLPREQEDKGPEGPQTTIDLYEIEGTA